MIQIFGNMEQAMAEVAEAIRTHPSADAKSLADNLSGMDRQNPSRIQGICMDQTDHRGCGNHYRHINHRNMDGNRSGGQWQPYSDKVISEAKASRKPVIIDFYTNWCTPSRELEKVTCHNPDVVKAATNFVMIKVYQ